MAQQHFLAALEGLGAKSGAQLVELRRSLAGKGLGEGEAGADAAVDLLGMAMVGEQDLGAAHPIEAFHRAAHVMRHEKGEIGRAPECRQAKADAHHAAGVERDRFDKAHIGDRSVQFRITDRGEARPHFFAAGGAGLR